MDRRFFIEAKSFCLLAKDGCLEFRLEEKRKGFTGVIFVSLTIASWSVDLLEEVCLSVKEDFSKAFREDGSALMVHPGGVTRLEGSCRWTSLLRVVVKVLFGSLRVGMGVDGGG
jgi:hypothetical protein